MIDVIPAVTTLATLPAILAVVNLAKRFGLSGAWSALVAVVLGVGFAMAEEAWGTSPLFAAARSGLILGLGAAGLYDLRKPPDAPESAPEADYDPKYDVPSDPGPPVETRLTATVGPGDGPPVIGRDLVYREEGGH